MGTKQPKKNNKKISSFRERMRWAFQMYGEHQHLWHSLTNHPGQFEFRGRDVFILMLTHTICSYGMSNDYELSLPERVNSSKHMPYLGFQQNRTLSQCVNNVFHQKCFCTWHIAFDGAYNIQRTHSVQSFVFVVEEKIFFSTCSAANVIRKKYFPIFCS